MLFKPTEEEIHEFARDFLLKKLQTPDYRLGQAWENYFDPPYEFNLFHLSDVAARHQIETIYSIDLSDYGI